MDNINFSIPVTLFDYRKSNNTLYSSAKLKIFYVGMTGDKRLFTKKFSDKLLASLPYVPVVGYYDEEEDDFKGHNQSVQYIYGIVPEEANIEYTEEKGKKYAVCDVILYTGRGDRTGEIAEKIVGKSHSLELNPIDTKYTIHKDAKGKIKSVEFTEGSLLGLSVLGDDEKPAFEGSGFFSEKSELMKSFESFREQMEKFYRENQRGEEMSVNTKDTIEEVEPVVADKKDLPIVDNAEFTEEVEPVITKPITEEVIEPAIIEMTKNEKLADTFMKVTNQETEMEINKAVNQEFGDYCYIIQLSTSEGILVYMDYSAELTYYRVSFTQEEGNITFGEKVVVKPRFLTEEEINSTFKVVEEVVQEELVVETKGTTQEDDAFEQHEEPEVEETEEAKEEKLNAIALTDSERQELETYRRSDKEALIQSFKEDLPKEFILALIGELDSNTLEELDTKLSKEFTRMMKMTREGNTNTALLYRRETNGEPETEKEMVKRLVAQYK